MNTAKPISTISYNTRDFLLEVLNNLYKSKIISFYMFIEHKGEKDLTTGLIDRDHIHLYVEPNRKLNTMDLGELFVEPIPNGLPLKCINWVSSKSDDFILYNLHDKQYLLTKFEVREYQYCYDDWIVSDVDCFNRLYNMAYNSSGFAKNRNFYKFIENGGSVSQLIQIGAVDPNQVAYYKAFEEASLIASKQL